MLANNKSKTHITLFNNSTIVVSQVEASANQFRIYIDALSYGILTFSDNEWSLTPGYSLPKGVVTLLTKRIRIGDWIER